jgi:adenylosuccinate synthase
VAAELDLLDDRDLIAWLVETYQSFARRVDLVEPAHLRRLLARDGAIVFEGAQGVLLDEWRGFHPHTTWSTTTLENADRLLAEADFAGRVRRLGITRAYATRHGAGPLVSEDPALTAALPDPRNGEHPWQRGFRAGWLDLVLLRYARAVVGPLDELAVTCLDRLADLSELRICSSYEQVAGPIERLEPAADPHDLCHQERLTATLLGCRPRTERLEGPAALLARLEQELDLPVTLTSWGPRATDKIGAGQTHASQVTPLSALTLEQR